MVSDMLYVWYTCWKAKNNHKRQSRVLVERVLRKDNDRKVELKNINVSGRGSQGLDAKTNKLVVNRQAWRNPDFDFATFHLTRCITLGAIH
jgi:hypothetical protein